MPVILFEYSDIAKQAVAGRELVILELLNFFLSV